MCLGCRRFLTLRTAVLVGGDSMEAQFSELASNPDIIVATPGASSAALPAPAESTRAALHQARRAPALLPACSPQLRPTHRSFVP